MGMIYKRGEVFWIKYYSGGKPIRESTGTAKQKQAERFLKDHEGRVAIGAPALPRLERIRFAEISEALIETRSVFDRYNITSDSDFQEAARKLHGHNPLALGRHGSRKCAKLNPAPA